MFHLIEQTKHDLIAVMAFRESGKSTIMNLAHTLWAILGKPGRKFVVIVSKTQEQAKSHFANIKAELENNELLRTDFGPFTENEREWNKLSMDLEYHGSKILSVTRDQSIRGLIHGRYRPDLIICDDLEDSFPEYARTEIMHQTQNLHRRMSDEIMTVGSTGTRIVILGNLLSENSFMMSLKSDIESGKIRGIFRVYPFADDNQKVLWPSRFQSSESVKQFRKRFNPDTWIREFLLKIVEEYDQHDFLISDCDLANLPEPEKQALRATREFRDAAKNDSEPQEMLIEQMNEFIISAPCKVIFPQLGSPEYEKYQKGIKPYLEELRVRRRKRIEEESKKMFLSEKRFGQ